MSSDLELGRYDPSNLIGSLTDAERVDIGEHYAHAVKTVVETQKASASIIQRRCRVGYNQSLRILAALERLSVIGKADDFDFGHHPVLWSPRASKEDTPSTTRPLTKDTDNA